MPACCTFFCSLLSSFLFGVSTVVRVYLHGFGAGIVAVSGFTCALEGRADAGTKPVNGCCTSTKPVSVDRNVGGTAVVGAATEESGASFFDCPDGAVSSIFAKAEPQDVSIRKIVSTRFMIRCIKYPPVLGVANCGIIHMFTKNTIT
jgi:hypothetical protein